MNVVNKVIKAAYKKSDPDIKSLRDTTQTVP